MERPFDRISSPRLIITLPCAAIAKRQIGIQAVQKSANELVAILWIAC
jgi:hypothetical protein